MLLGFHLAEQIQQLFAETTEFDLEANIEHWFTPDEQVKLSQLAGSKRKNRVSGHIAAKMALAQQLTVAPLDITINHHPSGAPFAQIGGVTYPVSISHVTGCGAALITANASAHIGIDVTYDRGHDIANLIERICTSKEWEALLTGDTRQRFHELWVLKEAALKAWGVGMRVAPWDIETITDAEGVTRITPIAMDYPELRGTIIHVPSTAITVGVAWSDETDTRILAACRQPRGLHIGC